MKKYIVLLFVAVALLGSSCEDFLNVNEKNPNSPSDVAPKLVLPGALKSLAATMNNPRRFDFAYLWYGEWSISAGYAQPDYLTQYKLENNRYQNIWLESYTIGNNFNVIEQKSTDPKDAYYKAVAKIMKAYIFQNLVDCFGDVPYSEAFQTAAGNLKPKYDAQQSIYEDLVLQLDAAIALIQNAPADANAISNASDIMYAGDMAKWLKFANTLKLRMLVNQSDMAGRGAYIASAIATTASVGYMEAGDGALVNPGYLTSDTKMNPFYEYFYNAAGTTQSDGVTYYFAGKQAVDFCKATNDPRISRFFSTYDGTNYAGNYFGHYPADLTASGLTSRLGYEKDVAGTMVGTPTKSAPLFTDFEGLFVQAEAAAKGIITADVKSLYEGAVTQSFVYMGLTSSAASTYVNQVLPTVAYDLAGNKVELILTQKWASLNGVSGSTIYTDYRRSGYPLGMVFSVYTTKAGPGYPPVRLPYPQNEIDVNNSNFLAAQAAQNWVDDFTTKIFWQNR